MEMKFSKFEGLRYYKEIQSNNFILITNYKIRYNPKHGKS